MMAIPSVLEGNKSATLNGMGYVFFISTPVSHLFIENEARPEKTVFEIGAGYSDIAIKGLEQNVGEYTVNDICAQHLEILKLRAQKKLEKNDPSTQGLPENCPAFGTDMTQFGLFGVQQELREAKGKLLQNLKLHCGKAPEELPNAEQAYDAILCEKILHFMNPEKITQCIAWMKNALKPNGKIYVTVASPDSRAYSQLLPAYLEKKSQGDLFPGYLKI